MAILPKNDAADDRYRERVGLGPLRPRLGVATPATMTPKAARPAASDDGRMTDPSRLLGMPPNAPYRCAQPVGYEERALALVRGEREAMAGLLGELRDRLRTLETRAAHEDRRTLPRGFSFTVAAQAEYIYTYCPVEPEIAYGLVVWPVPGLWIERLQVGRQCFVEQGGLDPKSDLREFLTRDGQGLVLYPSVGMTLGVRNTGNHRLLVEGAVFVIPIETCPASLPASPAAWNAGVLNPALHARSFPVHPSVPVARPPDSRMIEVAVEDDARVTVKRAHGMILTRVAKGCYRATFQDPRIDPDGHESWAKQCTPNGMRPWPNACESFVSIENQTGVMSMIAGAIEISGFNIDAYDGFGERIDPLSFTVTVTTPQR